MQARDFDNPGVQAATNPSAFGYHHGEHMARTLSLYTEHILNTYRCHPQRQPWLDPRSPPDRHRRWHSPSYVLCPASASLILTISQCPSLLRPTLPVSYSTPYVRHILSISRPACPRRQPLRLQCWHVGLPDSTHMDNMS